LVCVLTIRGSYLDSRTSQSGWPSSRKKSWAFSGLQKQKSHSCLWRSRVRHPSQGNRGRVRSSLWERDWHQYHKWLTMVRQ
jgi:hypothetical protein